MRLFTQTIQFVHKIVSILFKFFTVDVFEFDIFNLGFVTLIPFFFQVPNILKILDLFVNMIKIGW